MITDDHWQWECISSAVQLKQEGLPRVDHLDILKFRPVLESSSWCGRGCQDCAPWPENLFPDNSFVSRSEIRPSFGQEARQYGFKAPSALWWRFHVRFP